ncbi:MAG: Uma2 family endonuclease [Pirellulales bacterium]
MSVDRMNASALWNYAAYAEIPQDGLRHEIIGSEHYVNPAPNTYHQQISRRIQFQLYDQLELTGVAQVFDAPVDLELSDGDIVQPDLVVISRAKYSMITLSKIVGVHDLIVEIVSPSNKDHDLRIKRGLYERMEVPGLDRAAGRTASAEVHPELRIVSRRNAHAEDHHNA